MLAAGCVFETPMSVISSARRPARSAAFSILSRMRSRLSRMISALIFNFHRNTRRCSAEPLQLDCRTDQSGLMPLLGKLIAVEGIDGSGKHTQVRLLEHELAGRGF